MFRFRWDESYTATEQFMGKLPGSFHREKDRAMRRFGIDTIVDLQLRIASGTVGQGLSRKYAAWKAFHSLTPGRLQRSKAYAYHIKIEFTQDGFLIFPFGNEPPIYSTGKGGKTILLNPRQASYEQIAMGLEWGTKKAPARPHWMPTARRARAKFPGVMKQVVQAAFDRARSGGAVTGITGHSASVEAPQSYDDEEGDY